MNKNQTIAGVVDSRHDDIYGSVEGKVRRIAQTFEDCEYLFANYAEGNVRLDNIESPTIMYVLPPSGGLFVNARRREVLDYPLVQLWFLCPADFDFNGEDNECRIEAMKRLGIRFIDAINTSGLFEPIEGHVEYQVAYDAFDVNLTGICLMPPLKEKRGVFVCDDNYERK